jgi:hypothetical protein
MPWIDHGGRSEFRERGIVIARVVARRGVGWEAFDLTGKLVLAGASEQPVGNFRSLDEAKRAIESLRSYCDSQLPGSD